MYPGGQHTLAFYTKCVMPKGLVVTVVTVAELNCSVGAPGYFTLIGEKAPSAARDSTEVVRA